MGAIQQRQEDRKVGEVLKQAGLDPDAPDLSPALLKTVRGLVQQGYKVEDIATFVAGAGVQQGLARVDTANQTAAGFSEKKIEALRRAGSSMSVDGAQGGVAYVDPETGQPVVDLGKVEVTASRGAARAVNEFAENILDPTIRAAAAFGDFAKEHETLAKLAVSATQLALMGPSKFIKDALINVVLDNTVRPATDQLYGYVHGKAADFISNQWGYSAEQADFLANGAAFAAQLVFDGSKGILDSSKNISNIVNRRSEYPRTVRGSTREAVLNANRNSNGDIVHPTTGAIIPEHLATIEHKTPVVERYNQYGYNQTRQQRIDDFNDLNNLTVLPLSENSRKGAQLQIRYRQDVGPNYGK